MENVKNFEKFKNIDNNLGFDFDIGTSYSILILFWSWENKIHLLILILTFDMPFRWLLILNQYCFFNIKIIDIDFGQQLSKAGQYWFWYCLTFSLNGMLILILPCKTWSRPPLLSIINFWFNEQFEHQPCRTQEGSVKKWYRKLQKGID